MAAAVVTFNESIAPVIGMRARISAAAIAGPDSPAPSAPTSIAIFGPAGVMLLIGSALAAGLSATT